MGANWDTNRAVIVPASAGSGKTFRIAHEFMYDVLRDRFDEMGRPYFDPTFYRRILAVTFTNKATEEMKTRILSEIHRLASGEKSAHLKDLMSKMALTEEEIRRRAKVVRQAILHDYSHFMVLTNDTFFQRVLRAFLRELGIDLNFAIELDSASVFARSVDMLIERIGQNEELRKWIEGLVDERLRDGERWNIRTSIAMLNRELFDEATRDIVDSMPSKEELKRRVDGYIELAEKQYEAFRQRAQEAVEMIERSPYCEKDFSNAFVKIFKSYAEGDLKRASARVLSHIDDDVRMWFTTKANPSSDLLQLAQTLQPILRELCERQNELIISWNTRNLLVKNYRYIALLRDLQECVKDVCEQDNSMLLSETKHTISDFISEEEAPFIYEKVGGWYEKFMIDEFQDTSAKEWRNFLPLLRNAMANSDDTSVLIVGDVKQSIYRWRGGDWRILGSQVESDLGGGCRAPLKQNWRSLPNIVEFNNLLFDSIVEQNADLLDSSLRSAYDEGLLSKGCLEELEGSLRRAYTEHEQESALSSQNSGYIRCVHYAKSEAEEYALKYIDDIRSLLDRGFKPCDITILVRKTKEAAIVAEQLLNARDSFPAHQRFEITTEEALRLTSSMAVQFIVATMRLSIDDTDRASLAIYNKFRGVEPLLSKPTEEEQGLLDVIRMMSPEEAFEHIVMRYRELFADHTAYVQALHEVVVKFSANRVADISHFERWWQDKSSDLSLRVERSDNAIEIMTIHKSKGLENKVIILPMCSWSITPKADGLTANRIWAKAQEREGAPDLGYISLGYNKPVADSLFADGFYREKIYCYIDSVNMLYVALTRAKEQLYIYSQKGVATHIGDLLVRAVGATEEPSNPNVLCYSRGELEAPEPDKRSGDEGGKRIERVQLGDYEASPIGVKLRTNASRYFADERGALSPRSVGIRLHRIFEESVTREEVFAKLDEMVLNGDIATAERDELCGKIASAFEHTMAGEWFDGGWDRVLNERTILCSTGERRRPDRVMMRGKEAVVVDYKFGERLPSHKAQISKYMQRMRGMGYSTVRGYVWYVATGEILEVKEGDTDA